MANEVLVDALPYIDQGYEDPGVREAVNMKNMIELNFWDFSSDTGLSGHSDG